MGNTCLAFMTHFFLYFRTHTENVLCGLFSPLLDIDIIEKTAENNLYFKIIINIAFNILDVNPVTLYVTFVTPYVNVASLYPR